MASYRLSELAAEDLEQIYLWGLEAFGPQQASSYAERLALRLDEIAQAPERWPQADWLLEGCRRSVVGRHTIYYELDTQGVLVLRVLSRQDHPSALGE